MTRIVALSGSLRARSVNSALARDVTEVAPAGVAVTVATIGGIPLYDADAEAATGLPDAVVALKEQIVAADGLLLVTPEYNNAMPGVFKNAIDWLSRPPADIPRVFGDRPVGLLGATPGLGGTRLAQQAWLPVLRTLGTRLWTGRQLYVAGAGKVFDEAGALVDPKVRELLTAFVVGFAAFAEPPGRR